MNRSIPEHDSDLRISVSTTPDDIIEFLEARIKEPAHLDGVTVYNFNSHDLDARALVNADLDEGTYVVPYQVAGAWGFMVTVLPEELMYADLLTYRQSNQTYGVYESHIGTVRNAIVRERLREAMVDV